MTGEVNLNDVESVTLQEAQAEIDSVLLTGFAKQEAL